MRDFRIEREKDGLAVYAPAPHRAGNLLIGVPLVLYGVMMLPSLGIWLGAVREMAARMGPLTGDALGILLGLLGAFFTIAPGIAGVWLIAYEYLGVERVSVGPKWVRLSHRVGPVGLPRFFRARLVRDPRPAPADGVRTWWTPAPGGVLFDYKRRTLRFGAGLTAEQTADVTVALRAELPMPHAEEVPDAD